MKIIYANALFFIQKFWFLLVFFSLPFVNHILIVWDKSKICLYTRSHNYMPWAPRKWKHDIKSPHRRKNNNNHHNKTLTQTHHIFDIPKNQCSFYLKKKSKEIILQRFFFAVYNNHSIIMIIFRIRLLSLETWYKCGHSYIL